MILNLNDAEKSDIKYNFFLMPDGQPHFTWEEIPLVVRDVMGDTSIDVICSITSMNDLGKLLVATDAFRLNREMAFNKLIIPYFMGARQDRIIHNEPLTVAIFADIINSITKASDFGEVRVLHPHSDAVCNLVELSSEMDHTKYVQKAITQYKPDFLVIPDAGASKNSAKYDKFGLPQVQCLKKRDTYTGKLSGFRVADEIPEGKGMIVDDTCDRGGTFIGLREKFPDNKLALYTTHATYTGGAGTMRRLNSAFDQLFCTNSYLINGPYLEISDQMHKTTIFPVEY